MGVEAAIRIEAEQNEYARVLASRIGAEIATKVDAAGFLRASDAEIQSLAESSLAVMLAELGDETIAASGEAAAALGLPAPTKAAIDAALHEVLDSELPALVDALRQRRDILAKAIVGEVTAGTERIVDAAIAKILAESAAAVASDLAGALNVAAASLAEPGAGGLAAFLAQGGDAAAVDENTVFLRWTTTMGANVCFDENATDEETPSGRKLKDGAAGSCLARHGMVLPADDWATVGLPKDPRLLCSRFKRRNCQCRLGAATHGSEKPVDTTKDRQLGRKRAEDEPLDAGHVPLDVPPDIGSELGGALTPPGWVHVRVTLRKARPTP